MECENCTYSLLHETRHRILLECVKSKSKLENAKCYKLKFELRMLNNYVQKFNSNSGHKICSNECLSAMLLHLGCKGAGRVCNKNIMGCGNIPIC